jgi:hypothetical protein
MNAIAGWITVVEAAQRLDAAPVTVGRWCRAGLLEARRINARMWMIKESCLKHFQRPQVGNPGFRDERNPRVRRLPASCG